MSKDIYIEVFDELYNHFLEGGYSDKEAMEKAELLAYDKYRERLADMADFARLKHKEGQ